MTRHCGLILDLDFGSLAKVQRAGVTVRSHNRLVLASGRYRKIVADPLIKEIGPKNDRESFPDYL